MKRRGIGYGEIVWVDAVGPGSLLRSFSWRGRRYQVRRSYPLTSAIGTPTSPRPGSAARSQMHRPDPTLIQLRTSSGMRCVLSCDPGRGLWRMERVLG